MAKGETGELTLTEKFLKLTLSTTEVRRLSVLQLHASSY